MGSLVHVVVCFSQDKVLDAKQFEAQLMSSEIVL